MQILAGLSSALILGTSVLFVNFLQCLSLLVAIVSPAATRKINVVLCFLWFDLLCFCFMKVLRVRVIQSGDALPERENAVVISNHQSMTDIPLLIEVARQARSHGYLKWFLKDSLKWVPGIGWGLKFLDCLFVRRNWAADKDMILSVFEKLNSHGMPYWIVSYLEGTRFTPAKSERSRAFALKQGLPSLTHVLLPRTKGFTATLAAMSRTNKAVYDISLAYSGVRPPTLLQVFFTRIPPVYLKVRRYPIENLPADETGRAQWVLDRFVEKDAWIKETLGKTPVTN